jgi:hypothetical protein
MNWFVSLIVAVISGVAGLFLAGFIANASVSWHHISSREGASGYFVMFMGLGGGIAGFIIGLIAARVVASHFGESFGKELGGALGVILLIAGVSALLSRLTGDVAPEIDGRDLILEVEFRFPNNLPAEKPPTAQGEWVFRLAALSGHTQRTYRDGEFQTNAARFEAGRWVVPATVRVFTDRGKRVIDLRRDDQDAGGFLLSLPARPNRQFLEWSEWLPRQQASGQPWPADKLSYRFRVQKTVPPPPPKSEAEWKAEKAAEEEAKFAAIPADAALERWFPYIEYEQPQTERALTRIAARPYLATELGRLAVGDDAEMAGKALRCIGKLPQPTAELIAPVEAAGRDLAERIRKVNATTAEEDPSYQGAANVSIRFNGWMSATRALREKCSGDFTPELKTILELSRVRPDSYCMRQDVCRVASFYLHEWAGIAPLPSDPKPK